MRIKFIVQTRTMEDTVENKKNSILNFKIDTSFSK